MKPNPDSGQRMRGYPEKQLKEESSKQPVIQEPSKQPVTEEHSTDQRMKEVMASIMRVVGDDLELRTVAQRELITLQKTLQAHAEKKAAEEEQKRTQEMFEAEARARAAEVRQSLTQSLGCPYCNKPTKASKCPSCRTIKWPTLLTISKKRSSSVRPAEPKSFVNAQQQRSGSVNPQRTYAEDGAQRGRQMAVSKPLFYCSSCNTQIPSSGICDACLYGQICKKCSTRYPAAQGCCPKCERQCKNCKLVYDVKMTFCPHCNKGQKKLCKQCGTVEASGPSGLCNTCARPTTAPQKSSAYGQSSLPRKR